MPGALRFCSSTTAFTRPTHSVKFAGSGDCAVVCSNIFAARITIGGILASASTLEHNLRAPNNIGIGRGHGKVLGPALVPENGHGHRSGGACPRAQRGPAFASPPWSAPRAGGRREGRDATPGLRVAYRDGDRVHRGGGRAPDSGRRARPGGQGGRRLVFHRPAARGRVRDYGAQLPAGSVAGGDAATGLPVAPHAAGALPRGDSRGGRRLRDPFSEALS